MPARRTRPADQLIERQRAAAEQLRREVLGGDGSLRHPYFRDLRRQLSSQGRPISSGDLLAACALADLVYVGDFHADPACQHFAADLLEHIAARTSRLSLGVEFLYTRQQRILDTRQSGLLEDAAFLRRVHYREEWGYPWEGFRALLDRAKRLGVVVHALDTPPRGGFVGLPRRDAHAARRIGSILEADPRNKMLILFGESHLSRAHIPRRVKALLKRADRERREITVFQDPDVVYWRNIVRGGPPPGPIQLDANTYAVFHTSPLAKYEAYRQVLERWRGDVPIEDEVDLTPAVHHLIVVLLGWLGIRSDRYRVRHRAGWQEMLDDSFPEVYSGPEAADLLIPILEEHGRSAEELEDASLSFQERGALYEARSNTLFLRRYLPGQAAGEGARFLRAALSGSLFDPHEGAGIDPVSRVYGGAYSEALAYLGARLVDPGSTILRGGESHWAAERGAPSAHDHVERIRILHEHRLFEESGKARPPASLLETLRRSPVLRRALAFDLGHRLGRRVFERVRRGQMDQRDLRGLFIRTPDSARIERFVIRVLKGESPSRE